MRRSPCGRRKWRRGLSRTVPAAENTQVVKSEGLAGAVGLLIKSSPRRLNPIWRIGFAFPLLVVLWYESAGLVLDGFSVTLVALLLMFLYGAVLTLLGVVAVGEIAGMPVTDPAIKSKALGQAIAQRNHFREDVRALTLGEVDEGSAISLRRRKGGDSREDLFPLQG